MNQTIFNRLRRIEGQIRGVEDMVAKDKPLTDILIQLEAAKSSLASTISIAFESMLEKKEGENYSLSEKEAKAILRQIKKQ